MTTTNGNAPFIREWIEQEFGSQMMKETMQLSKVDRDTVKRMMSLKKFTMLANGKPTRWKDSELEKIGKEVLGNTCFTRILFFHPIKEKALVDDLFAALFALPTPSV